MDQDRPSAGGLSWLTGTSGSGGDGDGGRAIDWWLISPLIFTTLPLIRIGLRRHPRLRDRLFMLAVGAGLCHGSYLILRSSDTTTAGARQAESYYQPHQVAVAAAMPKRGSGSGTAGSAERPAAAPAAPGVQLR